MVEAAGIENVATPTKSSTYSRNRCLKSASWTFAVSGQDRMSDFLSGRGGVEPLNRDGESSIERKGALEKCSFHSRGVS
jgi:hypothetical protein